jgi:hypothetical protein
LINIKSYHLFVSLAYGAASRGAITLSLSTSGGQNLITRMQTKTKQKLNPSFSSLAKERKKQYE